MTLACLISSGSLVLSNIVAIAAKPSKESAVMAGSDTHSVVLISSAVSRSIEAASTQANATFTK